MRVCGKNIEFVGSFLLIETDKPIEADSWNGGLYSACTLKVDYLYLYTGFLYEKIPLPHQCSNAPLNHITVLLDHQSTVPPSFEVTFYPTNTI